LTSEREGTNRLSEEREGTNRLSEKPGLEGAYDIDTYDVEYVREGDLSLLARIYQPQAPGPFPMVIDVHGGVWTYGSRTSDEGIIRALASSGVVVASVDFRQPPVAGYPASIADVHYAVRWLKSQAERFGGNGDIVGGLGVSTGAHQLLLAAIEPDDPRYSARQFGDRHHAFGLSFIVLCWPIVDPLERYRWAKAHDKSEIVSGHQDYWLTEAAMSDGNPQRLLEDGHPRSLPPILILQGTGDQSIPFQIVERFSRTYERAGGLSRLHLFDGEPHLFLRRVRDEMEPARAMELIIDFVHNHDESMQI
jgi:acetyl esterase